MAVPNVPFWLSDAVSETGQRWMDAAGAALRVGTPFWCDVLAGRSVYTAYITYGERFYNNARISGAWRNGAAQWPGVDNGGSVENLGGYTIGTFAAIQRNANAMNLSILNGPAKQMTVAIDDGNTFTFNDSGLIVNGYRNYQFNGNVNTFYDYLAARTGQRRGVLVT